MLSRKGVITGSCLKFTVIIQLLISYLSKDREGGSKMKITNRIRVFVLVIITAFFLQVAGIPTDSYAKYVDRSGELPGMSDDSSAAGLTYVAVGLAVIALVYWIVKANKNKHTGDVKREMDKPLEEKSGFGVDSSLLDDAKVKGQILQMGPGF